MFYCQTLSGSNAGNFADLTYKKYRFMLKRAGEDSSVLAIGALNYSRFPVGLILGQIRENGEVIIYTLFVHVSFRRMGLGQILLEELEKAAQERGCCTLAFHIIHDHPYLDSFQALLKKCDWQLPGEEISLVYRLDLAGKKDEESPSMLELNFPSHVTPFFWNELTEAERSELRKGEGVWYPRIYSPFQEEEQMEPLNSLGLKDEQGNIFSWVITQRLNQDTILLRTIFGRQEFRSLGYVMLLVGEAVWIQLENGINNLMFNVNLNNKSMSYLIKKLMKPYEYSVKKMLRMQKLLPT